MSTVSRGKRLLLVSTQNVRMTVIYQKDSPLTSSIRITLSEATAGDERPQRDGGRGLR